MYLFWWIPIEQKRESLKGLLLTWDMATGRLFEVNRPVEMLPPGCWTPEDGIPLIAAFLGVIDPAIFGRLKFPWMLCRPCTFQKKYNNGQWFCIVSSTISRLVWTKGRYQTENLQYQEEKEDKDEEDVEERFVFRQYVGQFWTCTSQYSFLGKLRKLSVKIGTKMLHRQFLW